MELRILEEAGLTRNEAKTYLALLRLKQSRITDLSLKTGLHARNVYDSLNKLIERGLASVSFEGKVKVFKAENPAKLRELLVEKTKNLDSVLPEMLSSFKEEKPVREISILSGGEGFTLMTQGLGENADKRGVAVYAPHDLSPLMEETQRIKLRKLFGVLKEKKSFMRVIHADSKKAKANAVVLDKGFEKHITRKYAKGLSNKPIAWSISANTVFINFFTKDDILVVRIRSEDVATAFRESFEILWKTVE